MHNKVAYRLARGLRRSGSVVLRFNFRGVNLSEGLHDHGPGELEDARAALVFLRERYPDLPFAIGGFSFGSRIALKLGCETQDPRPERLIALGFPTGKGKVDFLNTCFIPKYFVHSTVDEHGPKEVLEQLFQQFAQPKSLQFIEAGDHFFAGSLDQLEAAIVALPR
jgi:alpha/beta superfamily hydrolase